MTIPVVESNEPMSQSEVSPDSPQYRLHIALEALKSQHEVLVKHMHKLTHVDTGTAPSTARGFPLPTTAEEDEKHRSGSPQSSSRFTTSFSRHPTRTSLASIYTESANSHEWFDAPEAGEEYVLEAEEDEREPSEEKSERARALASEPNGSSVGENSSDADRGEDENPAEQLHEGAKEEPAIDFVEHAQQVCRRASLPSGPVGDDGSLFAVLKKNIGKVGSI